MSYYVTCYILCKVCVWLWFVLWFEFQSLQQRIIKTEIIAVKFRLHLIFVCGRSPFNLCSHWIHSYWMFVYSLNGLCVNAVCHLSVIGSSVSSRGVHAKPRWVTADFIASVAFKEVQCECQCWFVSRSSWSFRIPLCWLVSSCVPCYQVYCVTEA